MIANGQVLAHLEANRRRILDALVQFAAIPSVSTDPAHAADIDRAARWVADAIAAAGPFTVRMMPTVGNPVVYAEWLGAPGRPTLLVYDNYRTVLKWNNSLFFASAVGYLADSMEER